MIIDEIMIQYTQSALKIIAKMINTDYYTHIQAVTAMLSLGQQLNRLCSDILICSLNVIIRRI